jgi:hypothetical protein
MTMNMFMPTAGVIRPSVRTSAIVVPRWMGSKPAETPTKRDPDGHADHRRMIPVADKSAMDKAVFWQERGGEHREIGCPELQVLGDLGLSASPAGIQHIDLAPAVTFLHEIGERHRRFGLVRTRRAGRVALVSGSQPPRVLPAGTSQDYSQ